MSLRKRGIRSMFKRLSDMNDVVLNILALLFIIGIAALIVLWLPPILYPPQPD